MPDTRAHVNQGVAISTGYGLCNAQRDSSASSFRATPPRPSRPAICRALALAGLALGHTPHAQRRPSLDQMGVHRLHLPMAPGILSALVLAGLALGMYVHSNFRSRGAITARQPRVPASVILARPHPSQQSAYLPCSRPPDCAFCARPRRPAHTSSFRHHSRRYRHHDLQLPGRPGRNH
jgi:hypothetical protein